MMKTYVLLLEDDCYYIGKSEKLYSRISQHERGTGSTWTSEHRFRELLEVRDGDVEKETTLEYMRVHGVEKVRGYAWTSVDGSKFNPDLGEEE